MAERLAQSAGYSIGCIGIVDCSSQKLVDAWIGHGSPDSRLTETDAIKIISRALMTSLSLSESRVGLHSDRTRLTKGDAAGPTWIRSPQYLIGIGERIGNMAAVVGFVCDSSDHPVTAEQQRLAQVGMTYADQLLHERYAPDDGTDRPRIPEIILRNLSFGFAVADTDGILRYMTSLSEKWLRDNEELHVVNGRLTARLPQTQKLLQNALTSAATAPGKISIVPLTSAEDFPKTIVVLPVEDSPGQALIVFGNAQGDVVLRERLLKAFGLTVAEIRLAQELLAGKSLSDAAAENNLTISTARSYLKRIFAKTGIHRQSQLITLYHTLMPPLMVDTQPNLEPRQH